MSYLSKGSKGEEVRKMQLALNRANCPCDIDGIFGDETEQALVKFQRGHFQDSKAWDGICGPATWEALEPFTVDYTQLRKVVEKCLDAVEALPEYKTLEDMLYG